MRKILLFSTLSLLTAQAFAQQQSIPEYCLENDAAHRYLTEVHYTNDYTVTYILDYADPYPIYEYVGYRKDLPNPVPIKLNAALDTVGTLYVSEMEDFPASDTKIMSIAKGIDSINVYNLIPGRTYNWKLEYPKVDSSIGVAGSGRFKTTGTLRMLNIGGIYNVRDMGGWMGLKGYPLKYGILIRGSRMSENGSGNTMITSAGKKALLEAGIKADLDLRTSDERRLTASPLGSTVSYDYENSSYASRIYTFDQNPASISGIKKIIKWLKSDQPVYFHCSVGADRTGTIAFLIGALCGMDDDALSKDYELTCFSADKVTTNGKVEDLRRVRTDHGRYDNTEDSYRFAWMVNKINAFPGETLQEKVYYHLKTGVQGTSIPESDLKFLINYMIGPLQLNSAKQLTLEKGQTSQMDVTIVNHSALNPNLTITYTSSNPKIVSVSETGLIKAEGCTDQPVTVTAATNDGFSVSVSVSVNKIESKVPANVQYKDETLQFKTPVTNKVKDGSFEYGYFYNWTCAKDTAMTEAGFDLTKYSQDADSVYLESKLDGDDASEGSIRMEWIVSKKKTYAFGFRVKNSTNLTSTKNENLKVMLTNDGKPDNNPDAIILTAPSYDGQWTEVQYVFTTTTQNRLRIVFTHLSQNGNNTCFDNFYLAELNIPSTSMINQVSADAPVADDRIYNLSGQEVTNPGKGVYIRNGKKYIIR